ncbi:DUF6291 domain-containing protein [Flavobacterium sp. HSC-61S13]|uniref:DUF6291 domain-containing protein n=1 Tax=Flavobacterium sp. HSC-61S13 TaxID=2910963 RepID=UPI00209E4DED|nr:DUF6291 domain-containing protein [Flavobacterium sp. HSC-61S13]MCP1996629.1 hypothetical protein [Flavobacterium sp. HSC-61S13]
MATDKKSFLLYSDIESTLDLLSDEQAGCLFKTIVRYVNDKDPILTDPLLKIAFEPIKQSLKRDLVKYANIKQKRSENGRKGGLKSGESRSKTEANEANASSVKQNEANEAVNDNGNVNVNDNVNVILLKKETKGEFEEKNKSENIPSETDLKTPEIKKRKKVAPKKEKAQIPPVEDFLNYSLQIIQENNLGDPESAIYPLTAKYDSWIENNWRDGHDNPIKSWKTKIKNTIPHLKLKPVQYGETKTEDRIIGRQTFDTVKSNSENIQHSADYYRNLLRKKPD